MRRKLNFRIGIFTVAAILLMALMAGYPTIGWKNFTADAQSAPTATPGNPCATATPCTPTATPYVVVNNGVSYSVPPLPGATATPTPIPLVERKDLIVLNDPQGTPRIYSRAGGNKVTKTTTTTRKKPTSPPCPPTNEPTERPFHERPFLTFTPTPTPIPYYEEPTTPTPATVYSLQMEVLTNAVARVFWQNVEKTTLSDQLFTGNFASAFNFARAKGEFISACQDLSPRGSNVDWLAQLQQAIGDPQWRKETLKAIINAYNDLPSQERVLRASTLYTPLINSVYEVKELDRQVKDGRQLPAATASNGWLLYLVVTAAADPNAATIPLPALTNIMVKLADEIRGDANAPRKTLGAARDTIKTSW